MKKQRKIAVAVTAAFVTAAALAGCQATDGGTTVDPDAPVTIVVGDFPAASQAEQVDLFNQRVAEFEEANPNITVETDTFAFNPDTFAAALAGGTLPTVYYVPFTEPQALIAAGAVADVTDALEQIDLLDTLNPNILSKMEDENGRAFGIPTGAYSVGLNYNRVLFEQAGLDPDNPPTTFDEVREAAKIITEKTGVPGFGTMASGNGGGWTLTALTYAFGGTIENAEGTESTLAEGPTTEALEFLAGLRQDGSMSDYTLTDFGTFGTDFAAQRFAMYIGCPCFYAGTVVTAGMPADEWGSAGMPTSGAADATLAGGGLDVINIDATPEQVLAAAKWVKFYYLDPNLNEDAAVAKAKADAADGQPVGVPYLSLFTEDTTEQIAEWIAPYVNVQPENFAAWVEASKGEELVAEPRTKAQDVYKLLDVLMQSVIADPNQDLKALVADYDAQITTLLSR